MTDREFEKLVAKLGPQFQPRFYSKIVGVTHPNQDGSDRAAILEAHNAFTLFDLDPDPSNPVDPKAVAIRISATKEQVGYLPERTAHDLQGELADSESMWVAVLREVTRLPDGQIVGANILIGQVVSK